MKPFVGDAGIRETFFFFPQIRDLSSSGTKLFDETRREYKALCFMIADQILAGLKLNQTTLNWKIKITTGLSKTKIQRNWLQHLKMPSNHSNIIGLPCKMSKSCHYGLLRNGAFYTSQWPKKHFRVAESGF